MNVSLTPKLEKMVSELVASGMYHTASEVVRDALRMLQERDALRKARLKQLKKDVTIGLRQLERGQSRPFDDASLQRIKVAGMRKLMATQRRKAS